MSTLTLGTLKAGQGEGGIIKVADTLRTDSEFIAEEASTFKKPATFQKPFQTVTNMLHLQHRVAGSSASGTFSAGAWRRRPINHVRWNTIENASFDSVNVTFDLPIGTYWMELYSCAFYVQNNTLRLYNLTTDTVIDYGDAGLSNANGGYNNSGSTFRGYVSLSVDSTLCVDHWSSGTRSNDGFGYRSTAALDGAPAIYADYMIWKIADTPEGV